METPTPDVFVNPHDPRLLTLTLPVDDRDAALLDHLLPGILHPWERVVTRRIKPPVATVVVLSRTAVVDRPTLADRVAHAVALARLSLYTTLNKKGLQALISARIALASSSPAALAHLDRIVACANPELELALLRVAAGAADPQADPRPIDVALSALTVWVHLRHH